MNFKEFQAKMRLQTIAREIDDMRSRMYDYGNYKTERRAVMQESEADLNWASTLIQRALAPLRGRSDD